MRGVRRWALRESRGGGREKGGGGTNRHFSAIGKKKFSNIRVILYLTSSWNDTKYLKGTSNNSDFVIGLTIATARRPFSLLS